MLHVIGPLKLHFKTVCKSMSIYFIGKCASIIQLSLGDLFWQACSSKEAHVNRHSSSESEL